MNIEGLFDVLSAIHPLSEEFKAALQRVAIPLVLPRNHFLLDAPRIASHAYYLVDGFVISYSFVDGKKITETFWKSGQIFLSFKSFFEQRPSLEYLQLMKDSTLLCLSYEQVQQLLTSFPEAQHLYHTLLNRHYEHCRTRIHEMQRFSALERLKKLLNEFPDLDELVSQDAIASYLGITPQSLSRLKKKL